jgi:hypothetical protein
MKIMAGSAALGGMRSVSYLPFWRTKLEVCARIQHMHNPAQNQPIVITARPRLVSRQMRCDLRPLLIVEPKQMRFHRLAPISVDQLLESKHG